MLAQNASKSPNLLPADEAPPPYTPPRLLTDTQNNMDTIAEDNSATETNVPKSVKSPALLTAGMINCSRQTDQTVRQKEEPLYDDHPAFRRNAKRAPLSNNGDVKILDRSMITTESSGQTTERPQSPHTPPGMLTFA